MKRDFISAKSIQLTIEHCRRRSQMSRIAYHQRLRFSQLTTDTLQSTEGIAGVRVEN